MGRTSGHAVILSSPGMGHRIPVVELSKRLVHLQGFSVTIFVAKMTSSPPEPPSHDGLPGQIKMIDLPVDISRLVKPDSAVVTKLAVSMREACKALRQSIWAMEIKPTVLIVDLFGTEGLDVADELGLPKYVFFTTSAWFYALTRHIPVLDLEVVGEYVDRIEPLPLPGCKPLRPEDVVDPMLDRSDQQYREYLRVGKNLRKADGILLNSWEDLEPTTLPAVRENTLMPVYSVGPLTRQPDPPAVKDAAIEWLDQQPKESVIYVSFGSAGTLTAEQTYELACGLGLCGHKFLWVIRPPTDAGPSGAFFNGQQEAQLPCSNYLPQGFFIRTQKVGLLIPSWAPQVDVLQHPSVGAFLSHCGWNSTLESISNGIPLLAWPMYAEQKMNATMLAHDLRVALRPKTEPFRRLITSDEISLCIRNIMDDEAGKATRRVAKHLQSSATKALSLGGSSHLSLSLFADTCNSVSRLV